MSHKPRTAVLTIQASRPSGNATAVDWWHHFLLAWGHEAHTIMASFAPEDLPRMDRLKWVWQHWNPYQPATEPHPTQAVAALPLPLWLFYLTPQLLLGPMLPRFDGVVYGGGPVLGALPAALRGVPFIAWVGTRYEDEIMGKVMAGDPWATRLRNSWYWPLIGWQERFILRRAQRVIAMSPHTLQRLREAAPSITPKSDVALIPTPVRQSTPPPALEGRYLLTVSRINDPRKNIPLMLRAFARLNAPDCRLVLVGDDPNPTLRDLTTELGLAERVMFMGRVSDELLRAVLAHAMAFVFSSTQEGLGIAMLEAMAYGVPIITTRCGGPEGIVQSEVNGIMVPNQDEQALAEAMQRLVDDEGYRVGLGANARHYIAEHASPEVVGQQLYEHYHAVFGKA